MYGMQTCEGIKDGAMSYLNEAKCSAQSPL